MRLTAIRNHMRFGNLAKVRGIIYYRLSPFEQKAFAGALTHGIPNTIRRMREQVLRIAPSFIISYFVYSWAKQEHERLVRKKPGEFDDV